jgi:hypothetical protein
MFSIVVFSILSFDCKKNWKIPAHFDGTRELDPVRLGLCFRFGTLSSEKRLAPKSRRFNYVQCLFRNIKAAEKFLEFERNN